MTTYCLSSASRSRPSAFVAICFGGDRLPQEPLPPNVMVDTPDDEPLEQDDDADPAAPLLGPNHKRVPDEGRGV